MHIESRDFVDHPASEVYPLVRDHLVDLLPYLPDVEAISVVSYQRTSDTRVQIVNRWRAKSAIPAVVEKFVGKDVLQWTDTAEWQDDTWRVVYRLVGFGYEVTGVNTFAPEGKGTRLHVSADVVIHPEAFRIPRLVFNSVFPKVEGLVRAAVQPNLTALARGLQAYYRARPPGA